MNDMAYFVTLLRYIHQNPTKAGIVSKVGDYDWSSWKEYTGEVPGALGLCATNAILKRMSLDELKELVEAPLDDDVQCWIFMALRTLSRCRKWTRRSVMR